jgi:hypothetical protein
MNERIQGIKRRFGATRVFTVSETEIGKLSLIGRSVSDQNEMRKKAKLSRRSSHIERSPIHTDIKSSEK